MGYALCIYLKELRFVYVQIFFFTGLNDCPLLHVYHLSPEDIFAKLNGGTV